MVDLNRKITIINTDEQKSTNQHISYMCYQVNPVQNRFISREPQKPWDLPTNHSAASQWEIESLFKSSSHDFHKQYHNLSLKWCYNIVAQVDVFFLHFWDIENLYYYGWRFSLFFTKHANISRLSVCSNVQSTFSILMWTDRHVMHRTKHAVSHTCSRLSFRQQAEGTPAISCSTRGD